MPQRVDITAELRTKFLKCPGPSVTQCIETGTSRSAACTYVAQTLHSQALAPTPPQRSTAPGQARWVVPGCATAEGCPCMGVWQCLSEVHAAVPSQNNQQRAPEYHEGQGLCNAGGGAVERGCSLAGCCNAACSGQEECLSAGAAYSWRGRPARLRLRLQHKASCAGQPCSQQAELSMLHIADQTQPDLLRDSCTHPGKPVHQAAWRTLTCSTREAAECC